MNEIAWQDVPEQEGKATAGQSTCHISDLFAVDGSDGALDRTTEASHHHIGQTLQVTVENSLQHAVLPADGAPLVPVIHGNPV
jgi:hypothetical protein